MCYLCPILESTALQKGKHPAWQHWMCDHLQVKAVQETLGRAVKDSLLAVIMRDLTEEEGCTLIQGMDCLVRLIKQQQQSDPNLTSDQDSACFW